MPRPSKLTPKIRKQLCELIGQGHYLEIACKASGLDYTTFRRWMVRGQEEEEGPYRQFCDAVNGAQAQAEVTILNHWLKQVPRDWKACRDLLERRFRDRWSRNDKVELSGNVNLTNDIDSDIDRLLAQLGTGSQVPAEVETPGQSEPANPAG
jgi:hypothetical protein